MTAYPDRIQHGANTLGRLGSAHQLQCPSHSSTGLSTQQSSLLPVHTDLGSKPLSPGLTEHVAPQQSVEEVGETSLLHQQVAAGTHTSSGSSACETLLSLCCCCQGTCCTVHFCMIGTFVIKTPTLATTSLPDWTVCC